nr:MAG TPA: hypothetical protein [Caudoviricetes sp.]
MNPLQEQLINRILLEMEQDLGGSELKRLKDVLTTK